MPMKVIVCFDTVRVTVPCGEGEIPVRELINKAVHRYKRATGKGTNHWVAVSNLKSISGGGILDPDDQLSDVVDDREQLIAEFEEADHPSTQHHNGGDGASASSTGTTSPDIFQSGDGSRLRDPRPGAEAGSFLFQAGSLDTSNSSRATDVVVTPRDLSLGSTLRVRRGSEPSLNLLTEEPINLQQVTSVRPAIPRRESVRESDDPRSESSDEDKKLKMTTYGSLDRKKLGARFSRDAFRTSLSNRPEMYRWLEAQGRQEERIKQAKERLGPVEGHDGKDLNEQPDSNGSLICLQNDGGPLGIHAVPAYDQKGKDKGLLIQSIEPGRPVSQDGRIQPNDVIVEINGSSLYDVPFLKAQEIFRAAMETPEIRLLVVKEMATTPQVSTSSQPAGPPVMPKPRSHLPLKPSPLTLPREQHPVPAPREHARSLSPSTKNDDSTSQPLNGIKNVDAFQTSGLQTHSSNSSTSSSGFRKPSDSAQPTAKRTSTTANVIKPGPPIKPPKRTPPALPARNPTTALSSHIPEAPLNALTNTRRIGKKLEIQLKKGTLGLGFSVTSRDNQTDGNCPIYIRNILPKGAAVQDGQLKSGDRLLKVNDVEMTGKSQAEAVALLRRLPEGSVVTLVVSRQEEVDEKFKVPRKLGQPSAVEDKRDEEKEEEEVEEDIEEEHEENDDADPIPSQPHTKSLEEVDAAPWTGQEKITLHIPLNDTGSAGLGVSVKGKTESTETGVRDLGIFVKTVLKGGAAYKDGRLQVNDQLLEVNAFSLEGQPNTSAMEALRVAMMDQGPIPGIITLTVARRLGSSVSSPFPLDDSPDNTQMDIPLLTGQYGSSSMPDAEPPVIHQRSSSASEFIAHQPMQSFGSDKDMPSPIPPVRSKRVAALREKFSGGGSGLRNESYTKATNDSTVDAGLRDESYTKVAHNAPIDGGLRNESYAKATHDSLNEGTGIMPQLNPIHSGFSEKTEMTAVITGDDTYAQLKKIQRPHSTIGFLHGGPLSPHSSISDDEAFRRASVTSSKEESDLSPTAIPVLPFAREGFGRQSMSEKRKGHLDPRSTETYKLVKANKENRGGFLGRRVRSFHVTGTGEGNAAPTSPRVPHQAEEGTGMGAHSSQTPGMVHEPTLSIYHNNQPKQDPPASNLKHSSSLEDLTNSQSTSAEIVTSNSNSQQIRDLSPGWRSNRFGRTRTCNESFRAAVDRSYDALDPALMDTLEEESAESGAFTLDPSNSGRSSISSEATEDSNSLKRRKAKEKEKKGTSGLLKGFLRFGKGRKSNEEAMRRSRSEERSGDRGLEKRLEHSAEHMKDRWAAQPYGDAQTFGFVPVRETGHRGRRSSQQEQERIEEEYARLRDHHVTEQRLRSQSVDPSAGRSTMGSSSDMGSPFQAYNGDPRLFHPAAFQSSQFMGQEQHRGTAQYSGPETSEPEGKRNIARAVMSRAEYIQQLRSLYQQKHRQRQGVYPLDDTEEFYEKQIQEMEKQNMGSGPSSMLNTRETDNRHYTDRGDHRPTEAYHRNVSSNLPNANNSAQQQHHHHHQQPWQDHNGSTPYHSNSRPQSRGTPLDYSSGLPYRQSPLPTNQDLPYGQHPHNSYQPHLQHIPMEHNSFPVFNEGYGSNAQAGFVSYEPRHQQFYSAPPQAYRSAPHSYTHHRGTPPHPDHTSAKV